jgi:hypothetical protein
MGPDIADNTDKSRFAMTQYLILQHLEQFQSSPHEHGYSSQQTRP